MIDLNWYQTLNLPFLTPPSWIFQPAWVTLYTLIFISLILFAAKETKKSKMWGYVLFFAQLVLNFMWTPMFFGMHKILFALMIIIALDILVFYTIREFFIVSKKSAYFLIPYFLWIIFATYLNTGILILN